MDLKKLAALAWPAVFLIVATVVAIIALRSDGAVAVRPTAPLDKRPEVLAEASESWLNPFSWGRAERTAFVVGQAHAEASRATVEAVATAGAYSRYLFGGSVAVAVLVAAAAGAAAYRLARAGEDRDVDAGEEAGEQADPRHRRRPGPMTLPKPAADVPPGKGGKAVEGKTARVGAGVEGG